MTNLSQAIAERDASIRALIAALKPFVTAYVKSTDPGTSDLYPEQPQSVHVTLGDCRKAHLVLMHMEAK